MPVTAMKAIDKAQLTVLEHAILYGLEVTGESGKLWYVRYSDGTKSQVQKRVWRKAKGGNVIPKNDRGLTLNSARGIRVADTLSLPEQRARLVEKLAPPTPAPPPVVESDGLVAPARPKEAPLPADGPVAISYTVLANQQARTIDATAARLDAFAALLIDMSERLERIETILAPLAE